MKVFSVDFILFTYFCFSQTSHSGHSMGGKTVMATSLLSPDRVEKLVVVDSSPSTSNSKGEVFQYMQGMKAIEMARMHSRKDVENEVKKFTKVFIYSFNLFFSVPTILGNFAVFSLENVLLREYRN